MYLSIYSGCEAKDSQQSKLNQLYQTRNPRREKTRREVSVLDVGRKTPENLSVCELKMLGESKARH